MSDQRSFRKSDDEGLKIYLEDGEIKVRGTIHMGHIGVFKDAQIEILDSLEEIFVTCFYGYG